MPAAGTLAAGNFSSHGKCLRISHEMKTLKNEGMGELMQACLFCSLPCHPHKIVLY